MAKKWEYKFENLMVTNVEKVLEKRGNDGWELIYFHIFEGHPTCHIILKREKEN